MRVAPVRPSPTWVRNCTHTRAQVLPSVIPGHWGQYVFGCRPLITLPSVNRNACIAALTTFVQWPDEVTGV